MTAMDSRRSKFPVFAAMAGLLTYLIIIGVTGLLFLIADGKTAGIAYFWTIDTDIPSKYITRNFSPTHITCVIISLIIAAAALYLFRRQKEQSRGAILRVLVIFMAASEVIDWIWFIFNGHYSLQYCLPLHLCSISIFIELAAVFLRRKTLLKEFVYALSMPAALFALATPGWYYPLMSFEYLRSLTNHLLLALVPALIVWGNGFRPDYRRLPKCFATLLFLAGIAVAANYFWGSNYMFLSYVPRDTTLQVFETWFGHPGYIFLEAGLIMIIWMILYLPWIVAERKRKSLK
jgi:hypothetical integral membrane protein (TIGR02206 family)